MEITMPYHTLSEAQAHTHPCSWVQVVIMRCNVAGRTYFRTYDFDQSIHKCKRCRKAGGSGRLASMPSLGGEVCLTCGNPYFHFVREGRTKRTGVWTTMRHCWSSTGQLH